MEEDTITCVEQMEKSPRALGDFDKSARGALGANVSDDGNYNENISGKRNIG